MIQRNIRWASTALAASLSALSAQQVIYETGFEAEEGFSEEFTLIGQGGWVGFGSGGNGIDPFGFSSEEDDDNQAYIGAFPPEAGDDALGVYHPISFTPTSQQSIVKFSVSMAIADSLDIKKYDDFRWSVYNLDVERLFTIDFDNEELEINYLLEGSESFVSTGYTFFDDEIYDLVVVMDFQNNEWKASLNGVIIVPPQPIAISSQVELSLGDIDAVWSLHDASQPGDNYMLFDDYRITVEESASIPPLVTRPVLEEGEITFRVYGTPGEQYSVEASPAIDGESENWNQVAVMTPSAEIEYFFDYTAQTSGQDPQLFYRVREL